MQIHQSILPGKKGKAFPVHTARTHGELWQLDLQERATVHNKREAAWAPTAGRDVVEKVPCPNWESNPAPSSP
jgi:hypothetical protein